MTDFAPLTRNFHEREFYPRDLGGTLPADHDAPTEHIRRNKLPRVAALLQWLRDLSGSPGIVTSYYRSPERNARVAETGTGGQHPEGEAADAKFPLISSRELARRALEAKAQGRMPAIGQLIFYPDTRHVHISTPGATKRDSVEIATKGALPGPRQYSTLTFARLLELSNVPGAAVALLIAIGLGALAFFFPGLA